MWLVVTILDSTALGIYSQLSNLYLLLDMLQEP